MLRLLLLRHAKSSWSDAKLPDRSRPLNGRGKKAAKAMGEYLRKEGLVPDAILVSPATRAQETLEIIQRSLDVERVETIDRLYDFGNGEVLLEAIRAQGGAAKSLMLIGHNPAIEGLAELLVGSGEKAMREDMAKKYPTAGLAVVELKGKSWEKISTGSGKLLRFVKPRALAAAD